MLMIFSGTALSIPIMDKAQEESIDTSLLEFPGVTNSSTDILQDVLRLVNENKTREAKAELDKILSVEAGNFQALEIKGALLEGEGNYTQAEQLYIRAAKIQPNNADSPARLSSLYLKQSQRVKSEKMAFKALELDKKHPLALATLARLHVEYGRMAKAFELYRYAAASAQDRWNNPLPILNDLARLYNTHGHFGSTIELFNTIIEQQKNISSRDQATAAYLFTEAALQVNDLAKAQQSIALLESWLPASDTGLLIIKSQLLYKKGNKDTAIKQLTTAVQSAKDGKSELQLALFKMLSDEGRVAEAGKVIVNAIYNEKRDFVRSKMLQTYANYMITNRKGDDVLAVTSDLYSQYPGDMQLGYLHASVQSNRDQHAAALKTIDQLLQKTPNFAGAYTLKGKVLDRLNKHAGAVASIEKALSIEPTRVNDWISLAYLVHKKQGHKGLLNVLNRGLQKNTNNVELQIEIARMYDEEGSVKKANSIYDNILTIDKDNLFALTAKARNIAMSSENKEEAIALIERAKSIAPNDPFITSQYGWTYHLTGDHKKGLTFVSKAAKEVPKNGQVHYRLSRIYAALGETDKAKKEAELSIELGLNKSERQAALDLLGQL